MNIEHYPEKRIFQTTVDGGIASALVKVAYDYALTNELVPMATCSYAVVWLERHPEYKGKIGKDYSGERTCAL